MGVHHRAARRTALALAVALAPSAALACPQCAPDPAVPAALAALALAPVGALIAGALWLARDAHRRWQVG